MIADEIQHKIHEFSESLLENGAEFVFDEYLLKENTSVLGEDVEIALRREISQHFDVKVESIIIVGSAKLWFSPKPGQYFKPFSVDSDVDVAIISNVFFEKIWREVYEMEFAGEYFDFGKFRHYHFQGWARPDKIPKGSIYKTASDWWKFFQELSSKEDYGRMKIRAGLYFDMYYFRQYHLKNLISLRENLSLRNLQ